MKLRITHALAIMAEVFGAIARFFVVGSVAEQRVEKRLHAPLIQFVVASVNPLSALLSAGTIEEFAQIAEMFFGMEAIQYLNGVGKQFRGGVPDPGRAIPQHHATCRLTEASAGCFPGFAPGPSGHGGTGGPSSRAFAWRRTSGA